MSKRCECFAHSAAECVCGAWDDTLTISLTKTKCSYCGSEYITSEQYDENFEKFRAASKAAWMDLSEDEVWDVWCNVFPANINQFHVSSEDIDNFAKAITAKLKELNT